MADPTCPRCRAQHPSPDHLAVCDRLTRLDREAEGLAADVASWTPERAVTRAQVWDAACRVARVVGCTDRAGAYVPAAYDQGLAAVRVLLTEGWRP